MGLSADREMLTAKVAWNGKQRTKNKKQRTI
jgi:hypothetical protein